MKEIKFRAWNRFHQKMYYVYELDFDNDLAGCKSISQGSTHTFGFIDLELMQFTGLHDSKGKEIYRGDIVYLSGHGNYVCEFPFVDLYDAGAEGDIGDIIGNIYDSYELLGV